MCCSYGRGGGNYDGGVSRGGGKAYDHRGVGGYQNSLSHGGGGGSGGYESNGPGTASSTGVGGVSRGEMSRSMSNDNWRDAAKSSQSQFAADDHQRGGGASRGWGNYFIYKFI